MVWAKTDDGVRGFLVETERPGFEARDIKGKMSLRASVTSELFLDDVEVPDENLLPNVTGLSGPLSCLTQARYGIAWGVIGAAMACFDEALRYAQDRVSGRRPDRRLPAHAGEARLHAHGDHEGAAPRAARSAGSRTRAGSST